MVHTPMLHWARYTMHQFLYLFLLATWRGEGGAGEDLNWGRSMFPHKIFRNGVYSNQATSELCVSFVTGIPPKNFLHIKPVIVKPTLTHVHRCNSARPAPKITPNYSLAYSTMLHTKYLGITTYHTKNTITLRIAS
jgi:hypothetical protein